MRHCRPPGESNQPSGRLRFVSKAPWVGPYAMPYACGGRTPYARGPTHTGNAVFDMAGERARRGFDPSDAPRAYWSAKVGTGGGGGANASARRARALASGSLLCHVEEGASSTRDAPPRAGRGCIRCAPVHVLELRLKIACCRVKCILCVAWHSGRTQQSVALSCGASNHCTQADSSIHGLGRQPTLWGSSVHVYCMPERQWRSFIDHDCCAGNVGESQRTAGAGCGARGAILGQGAGRRGSA